MFKSLPVSKYPTRMLYYLTEHNLIIYVQNIKGSKRKKNFISFREIVRENLVHFVSESIFKRLELDFSSSYTVSKQKIKIKRLLISGDQTNPWKSIITQYNEK